jgi:hypothetical protein
MTSYKKLQSKIYQFINEAIKENKIVTQIYSTPSFQLTEKGFINKLGEVIETDFIYNANIKDLNYENLLKSEKDIQLQKTLDIYIESIFSKKLQQIYDSPNQYKELINKSIQEFFLDKLKDQFMHIQSLYSEKEHHINKEYDAYNSLTLSNQINKIVATLIILNHPTEGFKNIKDLFLQQIKIIDSELTKTFIEKIKNPSNQICEEIFKTHPNILKDINPKQYLTLQEEKRSVFKR